jgi:hypothetical protein
MNLPSMSVNGTTTIGDSSALVRKPLIGRRRVRLFLIACGVALATIVTAAAPSGAATYVSPVTVQKYLANNVNSSGVVDAMKLRIAGQYDAWLLNADTDRALDVLSIYTGTGRFVRSYIDRNNNGYWDRMVTDSGRVVVIDEVLSPSSLQFTNRYGAVVCIIKHITSGHPNTVHNMVLNALNGRC